VPPPPGEPEWTSAATRNCERECNAILPIPGGEVTPATYRAALHVTIEKVGQGALGFQFALQDVRRKMERLVREGALKIHSGCSR
jgi:hypothetical protein